MEYIIVTSDGLRINCDEQEDISRLEIYVNEKIANGYTPIGGVSVRTGATKGAYFLQAMIKTTQGE